MGDFSMPLKENEKFGVIPSQLKSIMDLMSFIDNQALHDVDLQGANYTQTNRLTGSDLIQVKSLHVFLKCSFSYWIGSLSNLFCGGPYLQEEKFPVKI